MKKRIGGLLIIIILVFSTIICLSACNDIGSDEPIANMNFETNEDITLKYKYDNATVKLKVYPANSDTTGIIVFADKDGYIEVGEPKKTWYTDYVLLSFQIKPLYNGNIILNAKNADGSIFTTQSISIAITDVEDKPITNASEKEYLIAYGWSAQMADSFCSAREEIAMSYLKEIITEDIDNYIFTNIDGDECKVAFSNETVISIFDCDSKRQIFPNEGKLIIYSKDIDISMQAELQKLAEQTVKSYLISPSSAKFPWLSWNYTLDNESTNCIYITSYVDASNVYGTLIRNNFILKIRCYENNEYNWLVLKLGDDYYYNQD